MSVNGNAYRPLSCPEAIEIVLEAKAQEELAG